MQKFSRKSYSQRLLHIYNVRLAAYSQCLQRQKGHVTTAERPVTMENHE